MGVAAVGAVDAAGFGAASEVILERRDPFAREHDRHLVIQQHDGKLVEHEILDRLDGLALTRLTQTATILTHQLLVVLVAPVPAVVAGEPILRRWLLAALQAGEDRVLAAAGGDLDT